MLGGTAFILLGSYCTGVEFAKSGKKLKRMNERRKKIISRILDAITVLCIVFMLIAIGEEIYADYVARVWEEAGYPDLRVPGRPYLWIKLCLFSGIGLISLGLHFYFFSDEQPEAERKRQGRLRRRSDKYERCVICGRLTKVPKDQPISERSTYIDGGGPLCKKCYSSLEKQKRGAEQ